MNNILKKQQSKQIEEGFTLVETLIAVVVLIVAVVTPLSIASQAIVYSAVARDQIIASNLAQEAIDFIRNERDRSALTVTATNPAKFQNFLAKFGSYNGSSTVCYSSTGCAIDVRQPTYPGGLQPIADFTVSYPTTPAQIIDLANCTTAVSCPYLSIRSLGSSPTYIYGYPDPAGADYVNWRETSFKRVVKMTVVGSTANPQEVLLTVTVTWRTGSYDKIIIMNEYLKSWPDGVL